MTPDAPEPHYERFLVRYPGVVIPSFYPGGATLTEARVGHPFAQVQADEGSRVKALS